MHKFCRDFAKFLWMEPYHIFPCHCHKKHIPAIWSWVVYVQICRSKAIDWSRLLAFFLPVFGCSLLLVLNSFCLNYSVPCSSNVYFIYVAAHCFSLLYRIVDIWRKLNYIFRCCICKICLVETDCPSLMLFKYFLFQVVFLISLKVILYWGIGSSYKECNTTLIMWPWCLCCSQLFYHMKWYSSK